MPDPPTKGRWLGQRPHVRVAQHPVLVNFFGDRCPHLAAMVAYYALLSLVPFVFIVLSLVGLFGRADESSFVIQELRRALPGQSVSNLVELVESLRRNAGTLGTIGLVGLLWSSLGLLSAAESAMNIIYDVPNRTFLRQKLVVFSLAGAALGVVFAALVAATALATWIEALHSSLIGTVHGDLLLSIAFSTLATAVFLFVVYRYLPNTPIEPRSIVPGLILATIGLQISFQALPLYLRLAETLATLKAFGGIVLLLVWLYMMGNVILLGAEINWWRGPGRQREDDDGGDATALAGIVSSHA